METSDSEPMWTPDQLFPQDPEFYRRVLQHMPTPLVVVDGNGTILYLNHALLALGGWSLTEDSDRDILSYIHPEDRGALATSFVEIAESPGARVLGSGRPWAEISFRILTASGDALPIELQGSGGLMDPVVGGIIYAVRPAHTHSLLGRVLDGLSSGASMHQLLSLVAEMITSPPLDLDAVILQSTGDGDFMVATSTSPALSEILHTSTRALPWHDADRDPRLVDLDEIEPTTAERFRSAGYRDIWQIAVASPLTETTLRIVAAAPTHHVPANGPKNRMVRARELAAAVLLRTQTDVLLEYAADTDELTGLPNTAAFHQQIDALNPMLERAALQLDIDGLRRAKDTFGEATGDAVLQIVADRLRAICSRSDILGRIRPHEFAIVLHPSLDEGPLIDRAVTTATDLLSAVSEPIVVGGQPLTVTASVGLAIATSGIGTDHLLTWADAAMHDARRAGGSRICRYGVSYG